MTIKEIRSIIFPLRGVYPAIGEKSTLRQDAHLLHQRHHPQCVCVGVCFLTIYGSSRQRKGVDQGAPTREEQARRQHQSTTSQLES